MRSARPALNLQASFILRRTQQLRICFKQKIYLLTIRNPDKQQEAQVGEAHSWAASGQGKAGLHRPESVQALPSIFLLNLKGIHDKIIHVFLADRKVIPL